MTNLKVGHEEVSDVLKTTECIIDTYGPRLPGSDACLKVAVHLKKEYEKYCDRVVTIDYDQYPGSFFYMTIIILRVPRIRLHFVKRLRKYQGLAFIC